MGNIGKGKPLLGNKSSKSLNLLHSLLILVITLLAASPPLHHPTPDATVSPRQQNFFTISRDLPFYSVFRHTSVMSLYYFAYVWCWNFLSSFSLPIPLISLNQPALSKTCHGWNGCVHLFCEQGKETTFL